MTAAPPWPHIGDPERWVHLTVTVRGDAPGRATPASTFEIWSRHPAIVVREAVGGRVVRDVRANDGTSASLDLERQLCLLKTGQDPEEGYEAAIAVVAGPAAQLYGGGDLPEGWRRRAVRDGVTYYSGSGPLLQATLDPATGLPLEAISAEGRWRWSIAAAGDDPPPDPPDVTAWTKESHERTEVSTDAGEVEHVSFRSSSLGQPMEFIAAHGDSPIRLVIHHAPGAGEADFRHPDGRAVTVATGDPTLARRLVGQVHERLPSDRRVPRAPEDAGQWDGRINGLVGSITRGPG